LLTDYTSYDSVRAVLGVTSRIFPDTVLASEIYDLALRADLVEVGQGVDPDSDLDADFLALEDTATDFYSAVRLFAAHSVAFRALPAMPELSPTFMGDSKASVKKDQAAVARNVTGAYLKFRRRLVVMYAEFLEVGAPEVSQPSLMSVSSPDFDPVTGV
jgi:hypothetical protein